METHIVKPIRSDATKKRKRELLEAERPPFLEPKPVGHVETFKKNVNYFRSVI
jgi:hypothetical protein